MTDNTKLLTELKRFMDNGGKLRGFNQNYPLEKDNIDFQNNTFTIKGRCVVYRIPGLYWLESVLDKMTIDFMYQKLTRSSIEKGVIILNTTYLYTATIYYLGTSDELSSTIDTPVTLESRKTACLDIINQIVESSDANKDKFKEIMKNA